MEKKQCFKPPTSGILVLKVHMHGIASEKFIASRSISLLHQLQQPCRRSKGESIDPSRSPNQNCCWPFLTFVMAVGLWVPNFFGTFLRHWDVIGISNTLNTAEAVGFHQETVVAVLEHGPHAHNRNLSASRWSSLTMFMSYLIVTKSVLNSYEQTILSHFAYKIHVLSHRMFTLSFLCKKNQCFGPV